MDVSIIIVSYNTEKLTASCIRSIVKYTRDVDYEIIVVDNGSTDGSVAKISNLKSQISNLRLVKNKINLGFGQANNQGMKIAKGEFILLLNSDTKIYDNVLGDMIHWMRANPDVGIASCSLRNKDGSLQPTGGYFPTILRVVSWMLFLDDLPLLGKLIRSFHPHTPDFFGKNPIYTAVQEFDWLTGAFMLIRKDVIKKSGYFDEDYFMYVEEVDLCYRIKKEGSRILYLPKWSIIHYGGASGKRSESILAEYRGIKTFYKKHYPKWQYPILRLLLKIGSVIRILLFGLLEGKESAATYAKAFKLA
ncbi:MAG: Glycosyl transferase family 2 [uncultured bacterium]|uniref:Glycosyltransferase 2-like domain-containing protein n=1 Tax=Candidatus Woesebacteria bacterium RIFCSPHIGHO2_12_FULL_41_24 TaxID=1802510 RepID=A0A1F8AQQ8_9BACT|nr:MAG: Glycosyl transferase family 2 [uncultured bacterium]OGM13231.1 MAG: hypothetical protein A2W15_04885 [Candidatus Woesebacteria bacterium RBG_16_41_13]OGM30633.1 MAG: hypothetical protein A2873_00780 [Candidatus Woesebacteria bacterium RIFCSPHIGHO2_01_FULL_42_80]OGM35770.1 MAG: hypothetical protein A3D84_00660 [Candidatus Woesebacteria bacterium RIFCSPHIGHO2_02_FULL_42_20]OGM53829.1 MAG: hypothetical protein A3E44_05430 [Candidatus Woesebacteria bacterium RIFCSPHIGHO2_12_FULL_41_24]OGM6